MSGLLGVFRICIWYMAQVGLVIGAVLLEIDHHILALLLEVDAQSMLLAWPESCKNGGGPVIGVVGGLDVHPQVVVPRGYSHDLRVVALNAAPEDPKMLLALTVQSMGVEQLAVNKKRDRRVAEVMFNR